MLELEDLKTAMATNRGWERRFRNDKKWTRICADDWNSSFTETCVLYQAPSDLFPKRPVLPLDLKKIGSFVDHLRSCTRPLATFHVLISRQAILCLTSWKLVLPLCRGLSYRNIQANCPSPSGPAPPFLRIPSVICLGSPFSSCCASVRFCQIKLEFILGLRLGCCTFIQA
ncbi:hypothetical protein CPB85DRAFT_578102 [Mucidula mucida]|nr:hypothetical protein CPB85DRAFT_578102 [Mucidula mucida]